VLGDPLRHHRVDLTRMFQPLLRLGEARVRRQVRSPDRTQRPHRDRRRAARHREPVPVGGPVGVARGGDVPAVAHAGGDLAGLVVGEQGLFQQPSQRLDEVDVDELTVGAVHVAVVERHHHRVRGVEGGDAVGQHERGQRGRAVGLAGHVREARHRLAEGAEPGPVGLGPTRAVPGDVQHDDPRVDRGEAVVVEAPAAQCRRPQVHDHDVGGAGEAAQPGAARLLAQVVTYALHVAAHARPPLAAALSLGAPLGRGFASVGRPDLDPLGAGLSQPRRQGRSRRERGRVDHPQPRQRSVGHA